MIPGHGIRSRTVVLRSTDMVNAVDDSAEAIRVVGELHEVGAGHGDGLLIEGFGVVEGYGWGEDSFEAVELLACMSTLVGRAAGVTAG